MGGLQQWLSSVAGWWWADEELAEGVAKYDSFA